MNKFDLLFLSINPFISKVKQLNADNQIKNNESNDLKESDYIDINEEYKQKNTITSFYNIYNEEKKIYNSKNITCESETQNHNKVRLLVDSECEILRKTIFRFFKGIFFYIFLVRVLNVASDFFAPLLLGKLLGITTKTERNLYSSEKMECYAYIVLFILSCLTRIFTSMIFNYNLNMIRNQIEIIVNDLIYKKILVLGKNSKNSEAKITKFLNDDISTFFCFFINLNRSWEFPIEIILAIYGTYKHVSLAFLPGLLFAIVLLYVNYHIAISITNTNKDLYKVRLDRQELEILALKNVKSIKFEFLEKFFLNKIFGFRKIEFDLLTFKKYLDALCCYLWAASPVLISFFSIFSYILSGNLIDAEKVFTTISLLNMTIHPMNVFPWIFADMKNAKHVYMKFVKYLTKGKKLKLNLEKMKSKANFLHPDEEEKLNKNNNEINSTINSTENLLLNVSNVKIKYNLNANSIDSFYCKENNVESEKASKIKESFDLTIEKPNELSIERGELVVIYGNNASGKSLLLKAISDYCIDESEYAHDHKHSETLITPLFSNNSTYEIKGKTEPGSDIDLLKNTNRVYIKNNNISYVPQELWTFSASLYENITFNNNQSKKANLSNDTCNEPNEDAIAIKKRFEDIIKKCEMVRDIETFPEKELKIIDFKGSNISGGQKQRINIARAAFNKESDLLLFDNCLSSIDSNIANLIFTNLFQYLKSEGKGIVFVTSDRNWLKNADKVYFIEKNQLVRKVKSELKGFYDSSNPPSIYLGENSNTDENKNHEINIEQTLDNLSNDDLENQRDQEKISRKKIENKASSNDENDSSNNNNTNVSISYKTLIFFFSKAGYTLFITTIVFLILMQLGRNFIELFLADWLKNDKADLDKKKDLQRTNMKYYLVFVVLHTIATIGRSAFFAINFLNAAEKIYKMTIEKFIFSKIKCLQRFNIAYLTNLMQNEILTVDESLPFEFNRLLAYTIGLIGSFIVIGYSTFSVYFVVLFVAGAYYYKNLYNDYTITSKFLEEKRNQINQPLTNLFLDTLEGKKIINCFHKQSYFNEKLNSLIEKKIKMTHTEQSLGFWLSLRLDILSFFIYSIVMVLIGLCVYQDKYEVITFLSLAMTTALNITSPLSSFLPWLGVTEDKFRAVERIRKTLDCLEDEREKNIEESAEDNKTESNNNLNSAIELKNVHLKYDSKGEDILKNINFEISKGQKIAIIGRTGAGKSTIFSAITKQEEISAGSIHINSKNIKFLNHHSIRDSIAFISKDVFLIEGSIKDNLDFQNKYDASEIEEFLFQFEKLFENKEFEIFNKSNFKLNLIEKNGANLSEGQKNLLNILRALLKKKPIICFDESNSELDNETEKIIFDLIFEKYRQITFIIITHKLQILNKFDYVYLIDEGRISKQGVPADIINDTSLKGYNFE